jgi:hypothetical protein
MDVDAVIELTERPHLVWRTTDVLESDLAGELAERGRHRLPRRRAVSTARAATRMLAAGLDECRRLGLAQVLVTCDVDKEWSGPVLAT